MILWFFVAWYTFQVPRILPINATTFQQTLVIFFILTAGDLPPLTWWVKLRCLQSTSAPSRGRCKGDSGSYHENFNQFSSHLKERMGDLNTFFMKATFKQEKTNILRRSKILVWFWFWWLWPISHACYWYWYRFWYFSILVFVLVLVFWYWYEFWYIYWYFDGCGPLPRFDPHPNLPPWDSASTHS